MRDGLKGEGDGVLSWRGEDVDEVADGDLVRGQVEDGEASSSAATAVFQVDAVEDPAHRWRFKELLVWERKFGDFIRVLEFRKLEEARGN